MEPLALFVVQLLWFSFAWSLITYFVLWPRSATLPPDERLSLWIAPEMFRVLGVGLLVPSLSPGMPLEFAVPTAVADSATALLAAAAFAGLRRGWAAARGLAWACTVVGSLDLLVAFPHAASTGAISPRHPVVRARVRGAAARDLPRRVVHPARSGPRLAPGVRSDTRKRTVTKPALTIASCDEHLEQILELQRRYLPRALSVEQQNQEGFVFAEHSLPLLRRMAAELPQAIALAAGRVVAYCLSLPVSLEAEMPQLAPMFAQLAGCAFRGRPLAELRYMVGGQVCVDRPHRGKGLLARLYHQVRRSLPAEYDLCVTEIASRNRVSLRAHERVGFETIATYVADGEEWRIVAWDLRGAP